MMDNQNWSAGPDVMVKNVLLLEAMKKCKDVLK